VLKHGIGAERSSALAPESYIPPPALPLENINRRVVLTYAEREAAQRAEEAAAAEAQSSGRTRSGGVMGLLRRVVPSDRLPAHVIQSPLPRLQAGSRINEQHMDPRLTILAADKRSQQDVSAKGRTLASERRVDALSSGA